MKTPAVVAALLTAALVVAEPVVREAGTGDQPGLATLDDVAWLEGRWEGEALGGDVTEVYARTSASQMVEVDETAAHFSGMSFLRTAMLRCRSSC